MEIDNEIISVAILPLRIFQEGHLSVTGDNTCTSTGQPQSGISLPRNSVCRLIGHARHDPNGLTWP